MKPITVKLPEKYLEALETLGKTKYTGRCEAVRVAIRNLIEEELGEVDINIDEHRDYVDRTKETKIISVKIPRELLEDVKKLIDAGVYPSMSEAIRTALRELVKKELRRMGSDSG